MEILMFGLLNQEQPGFFKSGIVRVVEIRNGQDSLNQEWLRLAPEA